MSSQWLALQRSLHRLDWLPPKAPAAVLVPVVPLAQGLVEHPAKTWVLVLVAIQAPPAPVAALKGAEQAAKPCVARTPARAVAIATEVERQSNGARRPRTLTSQHREPKAKTPPTKMPMPALDGPTSPRTAERQPKARAQAKPAVTQPVAPA